MSMNVKSPSPDPLNFLLKDARDPPLKSGQIYSDQPPFLLTKITCGHGISRKREQNKRKGSKQKHYKGGRQRFCMRHESSEKTDSQNLLKPTFLIPYHEPNGLV